ncbi:MAG TPA: heme-binding protein [Burkholderiales bacterium]|nr:heme-binding protein [Burkholderiales bacterium]
MSEVTLEQSERIIDAIRVRGRELKCRPLSIAVTDPGAHVKAFKKEDGSAMMRFEMAMGKAYAALALGRSSSLVRARTEERPLFMSYLINASGGKIFPEGGGRLIRDAQGEVIGAVGVTGDTQERDEELAAHGIRAAGLKTDEDCAGLGQPVRLTN